MSLWTLLLVVFALGVGWVAGRRSARAQLARLLERLEHALERGERLVDGELHVHVAGGETREEDRLASLLNRLGDELRQGRLRAEPRAAVERTLIRETPNGVLLVDGRGEVVACNAALRRLLGITAEPHGRRPIDTIAVAELQQVIDETSRTRAPSERSAIVGSRDLLFRGVPMADGEGTMGVVLDVTSIRNAERSRRDFVANVSHELRTPVTSIVGYAEALVDVRDELPPHVQGMVDAVDRNARRLHALVEDVLQLSRVESRREDLPLAEAPLHDLVGDTLERFQEIAARRGVRIETAEAAGLYVRTNAEAFDHALGNLIDNAIKYGPAQGVVRVRTRAEGERALVEVEDGGPGIDPMHRGRIFERFYRGDAARSREIPGTGLGLALVKHLCEAMSAEIGFETRSDPAEGATGSTFTLRLPRVEPSHEDDAHEVTSPGGPPPSPR